MTNKNLVLLLCPALILVTIALGAFLLSEQELQRHNPTEDQRSREKFERFVSEVKAGKSELTPEGWIKGMRIQRNLVEVEREFSLESARTMRTGGWLILAAVACNIAGVILVRQHSKKAQSTIDC
jgi:hypothetical protein